ncbi:MAG: hypothetical protein M0C28_43875 [Candidatus Moduliflexus flocculans]|nr:hypothetical protein [Candidatus Moduliflexus flocculans]
MAERLAQEGIDVEVIDPRTLVPLDTETIINSVCKTGRLLVVHEACQTGGWAGEVTASRDLPAAAFDYLDAPVRRLAGSGCARSPTTATWSGLPFPQEADIEARSARHPGGQVLEAAMPIPFIMPKFDMDQEKATIVSWSKAGGDARQGRGDRPGGRDRKGGHRRAISGRWHAGRHPLPAGRHRPGDDRHRLHPEGRRDPGRPAQGCPACRTAGSRQGGTDRGCIRTRRHPGGGPHGEGQRAWTLRRCLPAARRVTREDVEHLPCQPGSPAAWPARPPPPPPPGGWRAKPGPAGIAAWQRAARPRAGRGRQRGASPMRRLPREPRW